MKTGRLLTAPAPHPPSEAILTPAGLIDVNHGLIEPVFPQLLGDGLQGLYQGAQALADGAFGPRKPYAFGEEPGDVADGLAHVEAHPSGEGIGTDPNGAAEVLWQWCLMVNQTGGAVVSVQVVLGGFHSEDDVFDEVPVTDAVVDEVSVAVRTRFQPTAFYDINGSGLLSPRSFVPLLPSSRSWLVGVGLVLGGLCPSDPPTLSVGWTDRT